MMQAIYTAIYILAKKNIEMIMLSTKKSMHLIIKKKSQSKYVHANKFSTNIIYKLVKDVLIIASLI